MPVMRLLDMATHYDHDCQIGMEGLFNQGNLASAQLTEPVTKASILLAYGGQSGGQHAVLNTYGLQIKVQAVSDTLSNGHFRRSEMQSIWTGIDKHKNECSSWKITAPTRPGQ